MSKELNIVKTRLTLKVLSAREYISQISDIVKNT